MVLHSEPVAGGAPVPEDVFAEFVARSSTNEAAQFDDWVREYPALEAELRELHRAWSEVRAGIQRVLPGGHSFFYRVGDNAAADADRARRFRALRPGQRIGEFQLVRPLGEGGQGQVWEAEQVPLRRRVALKLMRPERSSVMGIQSFEREGRAGGRLSHPGVVAFYSAGEADGMRYIAEELVEGGWRLVDFLDEMRKLAELPDAYYRKVAALLADIADALNAAHRAGVIHRDVKPHNILITPDERPKLTDFGMARLADERSLSRTGDVAGTYHYMSPEQVSGKRVLNDHRTDVFSLGVVMYESLTLARPFDGDTTQQIAHKILFEDPPEPRSIRSRVPKELALICNRALEKNPGDRYASMEELAAELRRWLRGEPILALPPGRLRRASKWVRRHPTASSLIALASAALVIISLVLADNIRARRAADALTLDVMRLSTIQDLRRLVRQADGLWPAEPRNGAAYRTWLKDAHELSASLPRHRAKLAELAALPEPWSRETRWWHDQLSSLVRDLEELTEPESGLVRGLSATHGPGVERRLALAKRLEEGARDPRMAELWTEAQTAIREDPVYAGLSIEPQIGLQPLGRDPRSGLWEFAHLPTGDATERATDTGELRLTETTGLVLVLLPGGAFKMGAQALDPAGDNYDPLALAREEPPHDVLLEPFFISKYEMTQGQWTPLTGSDPSHFTPGERVDGTVLDRRNPVESVSWNDATRVLARMGLELPSEAQWEYAARAGTHTPWSTGAQAASLAGFANTADRFCAQWGGPTGWEYDPWNDGAGVHTLVGSYSPNAFGLHDMHGNVWEWCQDEFGSYRPDEVASDDGAAAVEMRVLRGGSFGYTSKDARSSVRYRYAPTYEEDSLGLRPARRVL